MNEDLLRERLTYFYGAIFQLELQLNGIRTACKKHYNDIPADAIHEERCVRLKSIIVGLGKTISSLDDTLGHLKPFL